MYEITKSGSVKSVWYWLIYLARLFAVAQAASALVRQGQVLDPAIFANEVGPGPGKSARRKSRHTWRWILPSTKSRPISR